MLLEEAELGKTAVLAGGGGGGGGSVVEPPVAELAEFVVTI